MESESISTVTHDALEKFYKDVVDSLATLETMTKAVRVTEHKERKRKHVGHPDNRKDWATIIKMLTEFQIDFLAYFGWRYIDWISQQFADICSIINEWNWEIQSETDYGTGLMYVPDRDVLLTRMRLDIGDRVYDMVGEEDEDNTTSDWTP